MTSEVRNKNGKAKPVAARFNDAKFINHVFTEDDKVRFRAWAADNVSNTADIIDRLLDDGYRITLKYDTFSDAFSCFLQNSDEKSVNAGYILTGRSRSGSMALLAAVYRHYVIFEGQWPLRDSTRNGLDDE